MDVKALDIRQAFRALPHSPTQGKLGMHSVGAQSALNDRFTRQPRFGRSAEFKLPELAESLSTDKIVSHLGHHPFQQVFYAVAQQAKENGLTGITLNQLAIGLLKTLIPAAQNIEILRESGAQITYEGRQQLEALESFLPDDLKNHKLKSSLLYRTLATALENWGKTSQPDLGVSKNPIPPLQGEPLSVYLAKFPRTQFDPSSRRFLSGFIEAYPNTVDRTLPALLQYLQTCAKTQADIPPDILQVAQHIQHIRQTLSQQIQQVTRPDKTSQAGLKHRLSELWDKPAQERLMTEEQHEAISALLEKLESTAHPQSRDVQLAQLDTLLNRLPWTMTQPKPYTKADVRKILDDDHYGLEEVKTKIVDYMGKNLHLQKLREAGLLTKDVQKPTILCFVGPPGVGKTSLGKSIARAMDRKFVRIALGGIHDESEIRGHRSTYVAAKPGRIVQELIKAKTLNPVMLLDEIDKLNVGTHGNPASALLEVLDPEQNVAFQDNYLGMPVDLSKATIICTANSLETIPKPLRDRMQIIALKGYTTDMKLAIAKSHLIPRARVQNGLGKDVLKLPKEPFDIPDETLTDIIHSYAPSQGVRGIERYIHKIAEKTASSLADLNRPATLSDFPAITPDKLRHYLERAQYHLEKIDPTPKVGWVNGLAVGGPYGGGAFPEYTLVHENLSAPPHRRGLYLDYVNSNKKEGSKEGAVLAFKFVKANAHKLGIQGLGDKRVEVTIGSRDLNSKISGSSAGAAGTLAIISALTKRPVRGDMAMTGQLDATGKVWRIGGVREKVVGAIEQGAKLILLPEENRPDLEDVPQDIQARAEIRFVKTIDDVMKYAFADTPVVKAPDSEPAPAKVPALQVA